MATCTLVMLAFPRGFGLTEQLVMLDSRKPSPFLTMGLSAPAPYTLDAYDGRPWVFLSLLSVYFSPFFSSLGSGAVVENFGCRPARPINFYNCLVQSPIEHLFL